MKTVSNAWKARNRRSATGAMPLFAWADTRPGNYQSVHLPRAAQLVARRFGLPMARAQFIAELAGFPMEAANG
jgi:hypothetical protein